MTREQFIADLVALPGEQWRPMSIQAYTALRFPPWRPPPWLLEALGPIDLEEWRAVTVEVNRRRETIAANTRRRAKREAEINAILKKEHRRTYMREYMRTHRNKP